MFSHSDLCLFLLAVAAVCNVAAVTRLIRRGRFGHLSPPPSSPDTPLPPDQWFTQQLDHFQPSNNNTWLQRYQVVTDYYKAGGPVFLFIGGEGEASAIWLVKGNFVNYAKQYNAIIFQIEHRFYGKSKPTSDVSVDSLRYLSSEQALADIAYFVGGMTSQYNLTQDTKWIAFGGSYSGNLAAWVRFKYPHLIHGAMSASGPVLAKVDFYEYMNVVRRSLATYGKSCTRAVQKADQLLKKHLRNTKGRATIKQMFQLCDAINVTETNDVYTLLESLADNLAGIVQYNKDNRAFRSSSSNITIDTVCGIMVDTSKGNPLARYAAVNSLLLDAYGETCLDYKYNDMIQELRNISWESDGVWRWVQVYDPGDRCGQLCLFPAAMPANTGLQPTHTGSPLTLHLILICFSKKEVYNAVYQTNIMYGGLDLKATRVVYVHGSIDPWHALGVTKTRIPESPAIFIKGTAHCANMYPPAATDLPALKKARKEVGTLIGKWLQED